MHPLRLHILPGPVLRLDVGGDLCISTSPMLEVCVLRLVALRPGAPMLLDLRGVGFCDLAALRMLRRVRDGARASGVEIELRPSPAIAHVQRLVDELLAAHAA